MKKSLITVITFSCVISVLAQNTYNFVADTGLWSEPSNWEVYPGYTIGANDVVNINGQVLTDWYVTNNGTINVKGSLVVFNGITLTNNGIIENENGISNDGKIINNGLLNNNGVMYSIEFVNPGTFTNNGHFQTTGSGFFTNTGTVRGTNNAHIGSFSNEGILSPGNSVGLYTINNDYVHESSANINIEIGESNTPGTDYDKITINGNVSLDGALTTTLLNNFEPEIGDSFTILTANSVSGKFSTLNMPTLTGKEWHVSYNLDSVVLTVNSSLYTTTHFRKNSKLSVFPNPTNNNLYIDSKSQISKLNIYNNLGQLVLSKEYESFISVAQLKQGIYYIEITNKEGLNEIKRFTKI